MKVFYIWGKDLIFRPLQHTYINQYFCLWKKKDVCNILFSLQNLWFILPCFVAIWLYNIYQLRTPPAVGRREQKGPVSIVCKLYFLVIFVECLQAMAFPSTMLYFLVSINFWYCNGIKCHCYVQKHDFFAYIHNIVSFIWKNIFYMNLYLRKIIFVAIFFRF